MTTRGARLVVLGRQGAGKGTQCVRVAARLAVPHLSTGDLFRSEIETGTPLGRRVERYVAAGELVPDELVLDVIAVQLGNRARRAAGYVLDGFPRTIVQAEALLDVLGRDAVDAAVEIDVPIAEVLPRLTARRVCPTCGAIGTALDGREPWCKACDGPMLTRADDQPEAILRRLELYDEQSGPLLAWLDERGLLRRVDGCGQPDEVHARVLLAVGRDVVVPPTAHEGAVRPEK